MTGPFGVLLEFLISNLTSQLTNGTDAHFSQMGLFFLGQFLSGCAFDCHCLALSSGDCGVVQTVTYWLRQFGRRSLGPIHEPRVHRYPAALRSVRIALSGFSANVTKYWP